LAGNLVVGMAGILFFMPGLSPAVGVLFFLTVGIAGQVGDLFESELKRSSSVKDSSSLLPGHGGFLDRIDALLFASPVAYLFIMHIF
jgi:phosphatidate cytidylyltransferase